MAVTPSPAAQSLQLQADVVAQRMQPLLKWGRREMEITVTGASILSRALDHGAHEHGDTVVSVDARVNGRCDVVLSAQALAQHPGAHMLAQRLQNDDLSWRIMTTHEVAHCLRNPYLDVQLRHGASADVPLLLAARFAAEAYADGIVVQDLWAQDPQGALPIARALQEVRSDARLAGPWRTAPAIERVLQRLQQESPSPGPRDPAVMDRIAWFAALESLAAQGFDASRLQ